MSSNFILNLFIRVEFFYPIQFVGSTFSPNSILEPDPTLELVDTTRLNGNTSNTKITRLGLVLTSSGLFKNPTRPWVQELTTRPDPGLKN